MMTSLASTVRTTFARLSATTSACLGRGQPRDGQPSKCAHLSKAFLSQTTKTQREVFHAPFFTTRFCTAWTGLFCPLCLACLSCFRRDKDSLKVSLKTIAQNFRDRGVTFSYMHVYSLWIFDCTDVMALYSAHVSFVFLLSWVILHDQFVGVRVSRLTGREGVDGRLWYVMWSVLLLCCVWKLLVLVFSVSWSDCCWCIMS
ncbi:solute carrier family 35 member F3-like isoform X2 [Scylla paramamosain]|uniref:solute carrier family 35 member F3-like isoform X2 n=1 Tax=Scylla paramamosain TaxID=85552 RepID=UPI0030836559